MRVATQNSHFTLCKSFVPAQYKTVKAIDDLKTNASGRQFVPIANSLFKKD